jgi:2-dehydro-3-deoxyphosphogalactonate aldolase
MPVRALIVAPNTNPDVIAAAAERKMIAMPGFATPPKHLSAFDAGATRTSSCFRLRAMAPDYLRALKSVLPAEHVGMYAVGGVGAEHVERWLAAGAVRLRLRLRTVRPDYSDTDIAARAKRLVESVRRASTRNNDNRRRDKPDFRGSDRS